VKIGFVGMGTIGQMLVTALARSGVVHAGDLVVSSRTPDKLKRLQASVPGVQVAPNNGDLVRQCAVVFLCVKAPDTRAVLAEAGSLLTPDHLVVTVTNAITIPALEQAVSARVAKVIPSVTHAVGEGVSLLIFGSRCTAEDRALLTRLLGAISRPEEIRESQARVASDITSCGPAFLSHVFRALVRAARRCQPDLPPEAVDRMVRLTARATCRLLEETGASFDAIIARVSTPGGVTADGMQVLEERLAGVWEEVIDTTIRKEEIKRAQIRL